MHWQKPHLSWWSAAGLSSCSCKSFPISPASSSHTDAGLTAAWGQIPVVEISCAWSILCSNLKTFWELLFSIISQDNKTLQLLCAPAGTQPSWVAFNYIHGQVPQSADLFLGRVPLCSRTVGQPHKTGDDGRIKGIGCWNSTTTTSNERRRCVFSFKSFCLQKF